MRREHFHGGAQIWQKKESTVCMQKPIGLVHYILTLSLALVLVPVFRFLHLPLKFEWRSLISFWVWVAIRAIPLALFLYAAEKPKALFRSLARRGPDIGFPAKQILAVLLPPCYFLIVFFLVVSYNDVIAAARFNGMGDALLARVDSAILGGHSVSELARFAAHLSPWAVRVSELLYVGMFFQVGAAILLLGMNSGLKEALKLVGAITLSYYIALLCFWAIPATGPYYSPAGHNAFSNTNHPIAALQSGCIHQLNLFRAHVWPETVELTIGLRYLACIWSSHYWSFVSSVSGNGPFGSS